MQKWGHLFSEYGNRFLEVNCDNNLAPLHRWNSRFPLTRRRRNLSTSSIHNTAALISSHLPPNLTYYEFITRRYGISNTCTGRSLTTNIHGRNYTNVGSVSNSYNTIKVGQDQKPLRIQTRLSPLRLVEGPRC